MTLEAKMEIPIFIWYDDYPTHCSEDFREKATNKCRVDHINQEYEDRQQRKLGIASLNLTNIQESDRGWYNCKVILLNRPSDQKQDVSGRRSISKQNWQHRAANV